MTETRFIQRWWTEEEEKRAAIVVGLIEEMYTFRAYNFPCGIFWAAGHKFTIATEFSRFHVRARDHNPLIFLSYLRRIQRIKFTYSLNRVFNIINLVLFFLFINQPNTQHAFKATKKKKEFSNWNSTQVKIKIDFHFFFFFSLLCLCCAFVLREIKVSNRRREFSG